MNAVAFASPQLIAIARACAPLLATVPRVEPMPKNPHRIVKEPSPREARLLQAAHYFLSRHPEYTISQRLRFGRAHGFKHWEFRRAIRRARELSCAAQIADSAVPCSDRGSGCGAQEAISQGSSVEEQRAHSPRVGRFDSVPLHPLSSGSPLGASLATATPGQLSNATQERPLAVTQAPSERPGNAPVATRRQA